MTDSNHLTSCHVCGAELAKATRYPGLLKCPACAFLTADMRLSPVEIRSLYGHDYFHGSEYENYVDEKAALQMNFAGRLEEISALPGIKPQSSLYEIGCAFGFFMEMAQTRFARVSGIDISEPAVAHARNHLRLDAVCGDFLEQDPPFKPNVICMWDVIEHLERPDLVVRKAADILAPGGYLCITTGDISSLTARLRGPSWRMIHPPTHLHYFSRMTLGDLLLRAGLAPVSTTYPAVKRTVGSMLYGVFHLRLNAPRMYSLLSRLPGQNLSIPLNFFDIMFMIARKPA